MGDNSLASVLGVLAFGISAVLALVKLWETFGLRSKLEMDFNWRFEPPGSPSVLLFTISNLGRRGDGVREVRFLGNTTPVDEGWTDWTAIMSNLPIMLEPGDISRRFEVPIPATSGLGRLNEFPMTRAVLVDARRHAHTFQIPKRQS